MQIYDYIVVGADAPKHVGCGWSRFGSPFGGVDIAEAVTSRQGEMERRMSSSPTLAPKLAFAQALDESVSNILQQEPYKP
jgi:hypothetical protein